jgi:hypothetical protein
VEGGGQEIFKHMESKYTESSIGQKKLLKSNENKVLLKPLGQNRSTAKRKFIGMTTYIKKERST